MPVRKVLPLARTEQLIVQELPGEALVYDLDRHKAHCLNRASAFVWKHCDGRMTIAEVRRLLEKELATPVDDDVVWLALSQLRRFHLLEEESRTVLGMKVTRRDLVRKYLPAALALPLILSVPAPTAAQAASNACTAANGRPNNCPCTSFNQCQSNCCTNVGGGGGGNTCQPINAC
ncbi:MAG TPA: PqqD family protein [Pyrinomonadaceae bacterium]|nr:PqqD family protein [Pyrinomonadaceae bacterium]